MGNQQRIADDHRGDHVQLDLSRLATMHRTSCLGRLAGALVHEVNNPTTFITLAASQIDKAVDRAKSGMGALAELDNIQTLGRNAFDAAGQIRAATSQFQTISGQAARASTAPIEIAKILEAAVSLTTIAYRTPAKILVDIQPLSACPPSFASIGPALVEILINAIQAIPKDDRQHRLEVRASELNDTVAIEVIDDGLGMSEQDLGSAFEPFFSTKGPHAAGLGLTMAQEIVRGIHGKLTIESTLGMGTRVCMELPLPQTP